MRHWYHLPFIASFLAWRSISFSIETPSLAPPFRAADAPRAGTTERARKSIDTIPVRIALPDLLVTSKPPTIRLPFPNSKSVREKGPFVYRQCWGTGSPILVIPSIVGIQTLAPTRAVLWVELAVDGSVRRALPGPINDMCDGDQILTTFQPGLAKQAFDMGLHGRG